MKRRAEKKGERGIQTDRERKRKSERERGGREGRRAQGKREGSEVPRYMLSFALSIVGVVYDGGRERERE